ncbi:hypothetical protein [Rheinheimera oceanensis]|uniref:hypothetical protein n=1 Tax=Rheinheimera oceanensis TaxID=2817449 RepID=UPI001BFD42C1|nr:hypothetical protein [Rheinheimera oceanensis]
MKSEIQRFFQPSDFLEHEVLRPLSHIRYGWELYVVPNTGRYEDEEDTFAWLFNYLIDELSQAAQPTKYHDSEDRLAEHVKTRLNWKIKKQGSTWINQSGKRLTPSDYLATLEQGGFRLEGVQDLLDAAAGRVAAAIQRGQTHFDNMEKGHRVILAGVLAAILWHWEPYEASIRARVAEQGKAV